MAFGLRVWSVDEIKSNQDGIKMSMLKLDKSIHDNAVQCLIHAEKHNDPSLVRRLLIDIVDAKSGYRRNGLINWMRKFTPMELNGENINLQGRVDAQSRAKLIAQFPDNPELADLLVIGEKRPWLIELASKTHFTTDADNRETVAVPVFQGLLTSKLNAGLKETRAAIKNTVIVEETVNGQVIKVAKPIDPKAKFYDGVDSSTVIDIMDKIELLSAQLPKDATQELRTAQAAARKAERELAELAA